MVKDLTKGSPSKLILSFCLPWIAGNIFQQFYNMADTIIVGRFIGVDALAAVGTTGSLNFLIIGFVLGICSGFCIPVAQYFGAGKEKTMRQCIANALYLSVIVTILFTAVTLLTTKTVLRVMNTPEDILDQAYSYIIIIFAGIGGTMFYNILAGILRALGDSKTPLYFLIIASITNIVLDIVFIVVFKSGVAGAAYATVISQIFSGVLCFLYIKKKFPILKIQKDEFTFDKDLQLQLLKIGLPMALQFSITAVGSIILQSAVNSLGSAIVAAITAAGKIQLIVTQPMETLGVTMATYCGQNMGAGKYDRIKEGVKKSIVMSIIYCIFAWALMTFLGSKAALLFIDGSETAIISNISTFLKINSIFYPVLGILFILRNSIQGLGYGFSAMMGGLFELVARSLVAFCLVGAFGFNAVCFANPAAWLAADILLIPMYFVSLKKTKQIFKINN